MRRLAEEFYGQPERAVPSLCLALGLLSGTLFHSPAVGVLTWAAASLLWNHWSQRLVIDDLRLGPLALSCPHQDETGRPQVWLTFDDGPGPQTQEIVRILNEAGCKATFFFIGEQVRGYPNLEHLRLALAAGGHSVANHTMSHPNLLRRTSALIEEEMSQTQKLLEREFGDLCAPLFRPPFGYRNRVVLERAHSLGLSIIGWSCNSLDFLQGEAERVVSRVEESLQEGTIILFHDGRERRERTVAALSPLLSRLRDKGFGTYSPT